MGAVWAAVASGARMGSSRDARGGRSRDLRAQVDERTVQTGDTLIKTELLRPRLNRDSTAAGREYHGTPENAASLSQMRALDPLYL